MMLRQEVAESGDDRVILDELPFDHDGLPELSLGVSQLDGLHEQKAEIARALEAKVWPLLAEGKVKPLIHCTFPLVEAASAHALMESSTHIGKIVLVT